MNTFTEPGVLPFSKQYYSTPSAFAQQLFLYVTRCGHFYCDHNFDFHDSCEIGSQEGHKNLQLFYIRSGSIHFELPDEAAAAIQGQAAFIDCRLPHRYYVTEQSEFLFIHFNGTASEEFFHQFLSLRNGKHIFHPFPESHTERAMTEIITSIKSGKPMPEADYSKMLYTILCGLLFPPYTEQTDTEDPIALALIYIREHLFEDLPISQIASKVGLSVAHFSRSFRGRTGFSPHEYILLHRIDEAKALLHSTKLTIKEIAFRIGYHSEVNFITSFTDKVGLSPTLFRRNPF